MGFDSEIPIPLIMGKYFKAFTQPGDCCCALICSPRSGTCSLKEVVVVFY